MRAMILLLLYKKVDFCVARGLYIILIMCRSCLLGIFLTESSELTPSSFWMDNFGK